VQTAEKEILTVVASLVVHCCEERYYCIILIPCCRCTVHSRVDRV